MTEATDKNLNKIRKLLAVVDEDTLTRSEFLDYFSKVLDLVLKIQKKQENAIDQLQRTYENLLNRNKSDYDTNFNSLKQNVDQVFVGERVKKMEDEHGSRSKTMDDKMSEMESMHKEMMRMIEDKMSKVKDGYTPVKGKDYFDGVSKLPSSKEIQMALEPHIAEMKKELSTKLSNIPKGKLGMRKIPIFQATDFTSSVDGATTTFTLPRDTVRVFGVFSTQFPGVFNTSDWSLSGNTLTLNFTLQANQSLIVFYETLFYA